MAESCAAPGRAVSASTFSAGDLLRVASYNIHSCIGRDGRHDPDRIAQVIRECDPDVIGLQEVDSRYHRERGVDQIEYLAALTGLRPVAGPTLQHHSGYFGNGLLTRCSIRAVRRLDVSVPGREPRGVLDVDLGLGDRTLRLLVTHFGLHHTERVRQADALLQLVYDRYADVDVVMGDFNEWAPWRGTFRRLDTVMGRPPAVRSFPSRRAVLALDRIWVRPRHRLIHIQAMRSRTARMASDHLPVCAAIRI